MEDIHGVREVLDDVAYAHVYQSFYQATGDTIQCIFHYMLYDENDSLVLDERLIKHMNDGAYEYHRIHFVHNVDYMIQSGKPLTFHQNDQVWGKEYEYTYNEIRGEVVE